MKRLSGFENVKVLKNCKIGIRWKNIFAHIEIEKKKDFLLILVVGLHINRHFKGRPT